MAEDFYGTGDEPVTDAAPTEAEDKGSGKTYLINSDVCPGMKPGDEMVVKIERVLDGEYEVSYAPGGSEEEAAEAPPEMASAGPPEGMGGMGGMYD